MTIEIRELVIRAVVAPGVGADVGAPQRAGPAAAPSEPSHRPSGPDPSPALPEVDQLVARCVRDVLRALRKTRER